ncbi:MAG: efflux RND transporter periplasmic adaptor subunit [Phycisphaerae bacterium]|nr:efflux RND transporter periplasmic adaptor subunit [Phycisphaerae bacterium]
MKHCLALPAALLVAMAVSACKKSEPAHHAPPPAPVVTVAATTADVTVYRDYPGTTATIRMVEINARVEGWVIAQKFTDGQMVKEGDVLYEIDPQPFQVSLEQAVADFGVAEAEHRNAKQKVERNRPLVELDAISAEQFDQLVANERSTKAQTEAKRAGVDQARLNLSYCTVRALSSGQVSKTQAYEGTLVSPTVNNRMTNIQVLDPLWVQFNPIAADIPALRALMASGKADVVVSMPPGDWTRTGKVVFIDNQVDPTTDTILARLQIDNRDTSAVPGIYVNVRMPIRTLKDAVTVPETAVVFQTAASLVWTVEPNGTAKSQVVETGPRGGSGIVITKGLAAGAKVITQGQQKLREGAAVAESGPPAAGATPAASAPPAASAGDGAHAPDAKSGSESK